VTRAELYRFRLPLRQPLRLAFGTITHREGLLVALRSDRATGWGEACPLPGYSPDLLETVTPALHAAVDQWNAALARDDGAPPPAVGERLPSARMAVADARAHHDLRPEAHAGAVVRLAALLTQHDEAGLEEEAQQAARLGFSAVKLKVGQAPVERDADRAALVQRVFRDAGTPLELRLDANQAWTAAQALAFALRTRRDGTDIAFVEEPTADPLDAAEIRRAGLAIAYDESLQQSNPHRFGLWDTADAVVLKPTVLGGYAATCAWIDEARRRGVRALLSGCFESGVGHRMAALAAATSGEAAGLGTYRYLAFDVLHSPLSLDQPEVRLSDVLASAVGEQRLERLA
jgi:O-succinylbenzoate synthase